MSAYVGLRQGEYWERTENSDYYCGGCGWKVTDHDSFCPECGGALHEGALGRAQECERMSRESLLDEAIVKAKEAEDWQLVEWLRQARGADAAARWYTERLRDSNRAIRELFNENAKIRELAHILCHCMDLHAKCDDCRLNGSKGELAHDPLLACDGLHKMLRELGVEVEQ